MCGICGIVDPTSSLAGPDLERVAVAMRDSMMHRGPNDSGLWTDESVAISLGHRRLSIIDLSSAGRQPMISSSGRYVLVYNGEIYNFDDLRVSASSRGQRFSGHSDTEVLLALIDLWGVEKAVRKCVGMFSLGVWDRQRRELSLVRDRMGIKPLYYGRVGKTFVFASELKAFKQHTDWCAELSREGLISYLRRGYVDAPHSIHEHIFKLPPGSILTLPLAEISTSSSSTAPTSGAPINPRPFWSLSEVASASIESRQSKKDDESAVTEIEAVLHDAVRSRLVSDVPVGSFLSGGMDSTLVTAMMQSNSMPKIKTFSIGFEEAGFNEAVYAREVARFLETEHTEHYVSWADAQGLVPGIASMFDEPFADSSAIPTYFLARMTSDTVTVALSGDGGDELFAGYDRYRSMLKAWRRLRLVPRTLRRRIARSEALLNLLRPADRLAKLARCADASNAREFYRDAFTLWPGGEIPMHGIAAHEKEVSHDMCHLNDIEQMLIDDSLSYLPGDILTKVDRTSMACSLEVRVPLLDHRLVELVWSLPPALRGRLAPSKYLLRQVLTKYVPESLFDRPKMGFGIPVGRWLRGPLHDWASDVLNSRALRTVPGLFWARIDAHWVRFLRGNDYGLGGLWAILMLGQWLQDQSDQT